MFFSFGKISNIAKRYADTTKKGEEKHISNFKSRFSQTPLPSQVNISIKYWASLFLKTSSRVFLTPLEEPKWQRSKHIRKHACHYAVSAPCQWKLSFIKCTCPVCLECKKRITVPWVSDLAVKGRGNRLYWVRNGPSTKIQRLISY